MKKIITALLSIVLLLTIFIGCAKAPAEPTVVPDNKKLSIVCTIFPAYDWVWEILGDDMANAEVTLLLDKGIDMHSYQPTAEDMLKIASCDVFIYVGGESDKWVADALKTSANAQQIDINLLEVLDDAVLEEEVKEGMDHDHEEGHDHDDDIHEDEHDHNDEAHEDEHVWLSLLHAQTLSSFIAQKLGEAIPANAEIYKQNAANYTQKLAALDGQIQQIVEKGGHNTLIFGDRFPFRYLVEDYALDYYAAFPGCSAETEASFETIVFLAEKMDALSLKNIMVIETADKSIAKTIVQNTANKDQEVLVLNSLQSVTKEQIENGDTYLSLMEENVAVLNTALS